MSQLRICSLRSGDLAVFNFNYQLTDERLDYEVGCGCFQVCLSLHCLVEVLNLSRAQSLAAIYDCVDTSTCTNASVRAYLLYVFFVTYVCLHSIKTIPTPTLTPASVQLAVVSRKTASSFFSAFPVLCNSAQTTPRQVSTR